MSYEPRGPANETVGLAYRNLAIVEDALDSNDRNLQKKVPDALRFLDAAESIDCTRFLLFALSIFDKAGDAFARQHDLFWAAHGAISAELLHRYKQTHIEIHPAEISAQFAVKFKNAPWDIRAKIIRAFIKVAKKTRFRDQSFWDTSQTFLDHCRTGLKEEADKSIVRSSIGALVNFWEALGAAFGRDADVRERITKVSPSLLDLILDAELSWSLGLFQWMAALFHLALPVADPLQNQPLPPERYEIIQKPLDEAAGKIATICLNQDHRLHAKLKGVQAPWMCYLHGLAQCGDRVEPPEMHKQGEAVFRSGSKEIIRTVLIEDICRRTYRGFRIEVNELTLKEYHDKAVGLTVGDVEGRPIRTVNAFPNDQQHVVIDAVELTAFHPVGVIKEAVRLHLKVLRAWPLDGGRSGWALLAPASASLPDTWLGYVDRLTAVIREKAV